MLIRAPFALFYKRVPVSQQYFLLTINKMSTSTSTRAGSSRKRTVVENKVKCKEETVDDNEIVIPKGKGRPKRATKARQPIKIEVEHDGEDEDTGEVSKYFTSQDQEEKAEVKVEVASPITSPTKKKKAEPLVVEPPGNWKELLENIRIMRSSKTAVVDTMGCERTADTTQELKVQRFHTLISLMLSSQTKDQVTFAAMTRLKERGLTVQAMLDVDEKELGELIKPVGFYSRKATYIKKVAAILREKYDDDIPRTVDDLCALPGVGPKMTYICMNAAWNENAGIGVDTHVHRISNRLKWTGKKGTSTPEKTREALESWMPKEMWQEINIMLVGFGQEICLPIGPKCGTCLNKDICPSAEISRKPKAKAKK